MISSLLPWIIIINFYKTPTIIILQNFLQTRHNYFITINWFRFTIIIISDFSEKDYIWTLECQTFLWSRNQVHFGEVTRATVRRYVYLFMYTLKYEYIYDKTMLEQVFSIACSLHYDKIKYRGNSSLEIGGGGEVFSISTRLNDRIIPSKKIVFYWKGKGR